MGKSARNRQRHENELTDKARQQDKSRFPLFWVLVILLVIAGIVAAVIANSDGESSTSDSSNTQEFSEIFVEGDSLSGWDGTGDDSAIGQSIPTISGQSFDQTDIEISPMTDGPQVIAVFAHWCPHCQKELPLLSDYFAENPVNDKVVVTGLSTAASDGQPNFPPSEWFAEEDWPFEVLADDEISTAAGALGVEGFPYFVFVDGSGKVVERYSGEIETELFDEKLNALIE